MADPDAEPVGLIEAYVRRVRYPRLVTTVLFGLLLVAAGALTYGSRPLLGLRIGFVGAVLALFGASGFVAFALTDAAGGRD